MNTEIWTALDGLGYGTAMTLASVLWQSSLLLAATALIAWGLRRRRAATRHRLWVATLFCAPLLPLLAWGASRWNAPRAEIPVMPIYQPAVVAPAPTAEFVPPSVAVQRAQTVAVTPSPKPAFRVWNYPWALALMGYGAGAAFFLALVALGWARLLRGAWRGSVSADPRVGPAFDAARRELGLRRHVRVVESEGVPAPVTIGFLRPTVVLPTGLARSLADGELRAVAIHELAHVRRRDPLLLALVSLVRAGLFFHPLVWVATWQVAALAEQAADDAVLDAGEAPAPYARMLARLAESLPRGGFSTELAAGFVFSKSAFLQRVEAILSDRRAGLRRLSRGALILTLAAIALSLGLACGLTLTARPDHAAIDGTPLAGPEDALARLRAVAPWTCKVTITGRGTVTPPYLPSGKGSEITILVPWIRHTGPFYEDELIRVWLMDNDYRPGVSPEDLAMLQMIPPRYAGKSGG